MYVYSTLTWLVFGGFRNKIHKGVKMIFMILHEKTSLERECDIS